MEETANQKYRANQPWGKAEIEYQYMSVLESQCNGGG